MNCSDCGELLNVKKEVYHRITSFDIGGLWAGKSWSLYFCEKCNQKFENKIGRKE